MQLCLTSFLAYSAHLSKMVRHHGAMGLFWHVLVLAIISDRLHGAELSTRQSAQVDTAALSSERRMVIEACEHISDPSAPKLERCHDHFRDAIKASEVEYCGETASLLVSCEQASTRDTSCNPQEAVNASCIDTVWVQ